MRWRRVEAAITVSFLAIVVLIGTGSTYYVRVQNDQIRRVRAMTGGDADKAPASLIRYGCTSCHDVPGVRMPGGLAAPPLAGMAHRLYLGGVVTNTPENLVRWIVDPQRFSARTAMPATGISESEARNVAAYLYRMK